MIRNLMLAAALFTFTAGSALAAQAPARGQRVAQTGARTGDAGKETVKKPKRDRKNKKAKEDQGMGAPTRTK